MFNKPKIGEQIKVTTDWSDLYKSHCETVRINSSRSILIGKVVPSETFDDPATFRVTTGNPYHPEAVIPLSRVIELIDTSGINQDANAIKELKAKKEFWTIDGSTGKQYTVTRDGDRWSCTCPGFGFRNQCKHLNTKKSEVLGV